MTSPQTPYKGLSPYEEQDAWAFFGRDGDTRLLVANALTARITVVYGPSGVGKSSLLNARLVPRLREEKVQLKVVRDWRTDVPGQLEAWLAQSALLTEAARGPRVLILDQFEESLAYAHRKLAGTLAELVADGCHVLLAVREDALAKLDVFDAVMQGVFDNLFRLDYLDAHAAREAIEGPLRALNEREPDTGEAAVDSGVVDLVLRGAQVDPASAGTPSTGIETTYLQLVMLRLWREEQQHASSQLRLSTLNNLGGPKQIVGEHVKDAMGSIRETERPTAASLMRFLAPASGRKIAYTVGELAELSEQPREAISGIVAKLASSEVRILRVVPSGNEAESAYALFHDALVGPISEWRRTFDVEREKEALRQRNRRLLVPVLLGALLLTAAGATVAWMQKNNAEDAAEKARVAQREAQEAAEKEKKLAEAAAITQQRLQRSLEFRLSLFSTDVAKLPSLLMDAPRVERIAFEADATEYPYKSKAGGPTYKFSLKPSKLPEDDKVAMITYFMANRTFSSPFRSAGPSKNFEVTWDGVACVKQVFAIVEYALGAKGDPISVAPIDHCELVKPLLTDQPPEK